MTRLNPITKSKPRNNPPATGKLAARGRQTVTMAGLARLCGTTKMTVSRVFSGQPGVGEELRNRILLAAQNLNYEINQQASNFSSNRTGFIGLATPFEGLLGSRYFQRIVEGLNQGLRDSPHDIVLFDMLSSTFEDGAKLERAWRRRKVDGLIILAPHTTDHFIRPLVSSGVPLVVVGEMEAGQPVEAVTAEEEQGVKLAVEHLASLGHRRIAYIGGPQPLSSSIRRHASFTAEMRSRGLPLPRAHQLVGDYTMRSGRDAGDRLFRMENRPTAVFAANDHMALGVIQSALAAGLRVPADVSVVGFDDIPEAAEYWPPLTTVHQPIRETGEVAAHRLLAQMKPDSTPPPTPVLSCRLIVRSSTAAVSA